MDAHDPFEADRAAAQAAPVVEPDRRVLGDLVGLVAGVDALDRLGREDDLRALGAVLNDDPDRRALDADDALEGLAVGQEHHRGLLFVGSSPGWGPQRGQDQGQGEGEEGTQACSRHAAFSHGADRGRKGIPIPLEPSREGGRREIMRAGRSKVWGALLAGAGGGGLTLLACIPTARVEPPLAAAPSGQREPSPQAREVSPRLDLAAVISDSQVVVPAGFKHANYYAPPSLARARGWAGSNEALYLLELGERPNRRLQTLDRAYAESADPVARQNLIFLVALGLPWELAEPWLRLRLAEGGADRLDALWALAMSGAEDALDELDAEAPQGVARVLVDSVEAHEVLGLTGGAESRARLLGYRALEVVDRAPYFKKTSLHVHVRWFPHPQAGQGSAQSLLWIDGSRAAPVELATRLWATWVRGFPGHPGNDDVALRLGRVYLGQRQALSAARWFSRASVLPDQDVTWSALNKLLATAEVLLGDAALAELVADAELSGRNRELLQYVRMRRDAARRGCASGLKEAARLAKVHPEGIVAQAWARRWSVAPPRGLESGVEPLGREDPLLRREQAAEPPPPSTARVLRGVPSGAHRAGQRESLGRLDPHPEAVSLDLARLTRQLRLWETVAELARREAQAEVPERAADLRYKRAAVFFHQPEALFPVYTRHRRVAESVVDVLWDIDSEDQASFEAAVTEFAVKAQGWSRAMNLLAGFALRYPNYAGLDEALFTRGLACERFLRGPWCRERDATIRDLVQAFEDLVEACPESNLSDDAKRAVSYWRSSYSEAFK